MRRAALLLAAVMMAALLLAGGVALADTIKCKVGKACTGTNNADTLQGTDKADTIKGLRGADTIKGHKGGDKLYGDDGPDIIGGQDGADKIWGGPAPQGTVNGLSGGAGKDTIHGGDGRDVIYGNDHDDILLGKGGVDTIYDDHGKFNKLYGFKGNDEMGIKVPHQTANSTLVGGDGDDKITIEPLPGPGWGSAWGAGTVYGDSEPKWTNSWDKQKNAKGDDIIAKIPNTGTQQRIHVSAGPGDDYIHVQDGTLSDSVSCGPGNDTVYYEEVYTILSDGSEMRVAGDRVGEDCEIEHVSKTYQ